MNKSLCGEHLEAVGVIEQQMLNIWKEVLGRSDLGLEESLFDVGGDSLTAAKLLKRIQQDFQREVTVAALLQGPTVKAMAHWIMAADHTPAADRPISPDNVVALQHSAAGPRFFCVHPAGGNALCYAGLAQALGSDVASYGCHYPGLTERLAQPMTVQELARRHLAAVRIVQPHGPYRLGGWSAGGAIAFEMARLLEADGQTVALLAFFDCDLMQTYREMSVFPFVRTMGQLWSMIGLLSQVGVPRTYERLRQLTRLIGVALPERPTDIARAFFREGFGARVITDAAYALRLLRLNTAAGYNYAPGPYYGKAVLFRTGRAALREEDPKRRNLSVHVLGGVTVKPVAGSHMSIMLEPEDTMGLADALRPLLIH